MSNDKFQKLGIKVEDLREKIKTQRPKEIAAFYGVSPITVWKWLKLHDIKNPHPMGRPKKQSTCIFTGPSKSPFGDIPVVQEE